MLGIERLISGDPFSDHPQLGHIWPEPYASIAREAVTEHLAEQDDYDIGGIYLIKEDSDVIGITGYFLYDTEATVLGLRWHGLVPEQRGKGYSPRILGMVLIEALARHPRAETLIELVPVTTYGETLEPHFKKMGFTPVGDTEKYEWAEHSWQPYHLEIANFLKLHSFVCTDSAVGFSS
jgi:L-amino acid N-acyltransferase YncA